MYGTAMNRCAYRAHRTEDAVRQGRGDGKAVTRVGTHGNETEMSDQITRERNEPYERGDEKAGAAADSGNTSDTCAYDYGCRYCPLHR